MKMKFKSTTLSERALVYRRFIGLEKGLSLNTIYKTTADNLLWSFDHSTMSFIPLDLEQAPASSIVVSVSTTTILQYLTTYFKYVDGKWTTITDATGLTLLSAKYADIGKYQTNKYYYVGSIDCMQKGSISDTTTQNIKGNIIPLKSLSIKFFNDDIAVRPDDLIVFHKHLYSIETIEEDHKHQPKDYTIHFATLNSIL